MKRIVNNVDLNILLNNVDAFWSNNKYAAPKTQHKNFYFLQNYANLNYYRATSIQFLRN